MIFVFIKGGGYHLNVGHHRPSIGHPSGNLAKCRASCGISLELSKWCNSFYMGIGTLQMVQLSSPYYMKKCAFF